MTRTEKNMNLTEELLVQHAKAKGHATAKMAGKIAKRLNAKTLLLTHFSARYSFTEEGIENDIVEDAKTEFNGNVICAKDMLEIVLSR